MAYDRKGGLIWKEKAGHGWKAIHFGVNFPQINEGYRKNQTTTCGLSLLKFWVSHSGLASHHFPMLSTVGNTDE